MDGERRFQSQAEHQRERRSFRLIGRLRLGHETRLWCAMVGLIALLSAPTSAQDLTLTVDRGVVADTLRLSWSSGSAPYRVYRAEAASGLVDPANLLLETAATQIDVPVGTPSLEFFRVEASVVIDADSAVDTTSACLTSGSAAQAAVVVDLVDTAGQPVSGAIVQISSSAGTISPVESAGNRYWAIVSPPGGAGSADITVQADGVTLNASPVIEFLSGIEPGAAGADGCPADGNVRVTVLDENGQPVAGADVMIGAQPAAATYVTDFGQPAAGDNTAQAGVDGVVEFRDFATNLDGPQTITAAAAGRRYVTYAEVDAADVTLVLEPLDPQRPTGLVTGSIAPIPAPTNDPIELGVMLPDLGLNDLLAFDLNDLFGDNECYAAGGAAGDLELPSNVYIPAQCAASFIFCLQNLPQKSYTSPPLTFGERRLLALRGSIPLADATGGDLIGGVSLDGIGALTVDIDAAGPTPLDLPVEQNLSTNLNCQIDNTPAVADVFCIAGGDWDSQADPSLPPGGGRLFVTGFEAVDTAVTPVPLTISGVTTVANTGSFGGMDYLGGAIAQYQDPAKPGIPPGTADGASVILERSGSAFGAAGGTLTLDDFFPIRALTSLGRSLTLDPLPGVIHPSADLTQVLVSQRVTESYDACEVNQRVRDVIYWEVYAPGSSNQVALPLPPTSWPRGTLGGSLPGLVDPAATAEDDSLRWGATTFHFEGLGTFEFDRFRIEALRLNTTHATSNGVAY